MITNKVRYPIYIPSKGRSTACLTAKALGKDKVPFKIVVEPQEFDAYAEVFGKENLIRLPFSNLGSVIPARNWIKEYSTKRGEKRHWQLDDNIAKAYRIYKGFRVPCDFGVALSVAEDFVDRYENIAIAGLEYSMFSPETNKKPPFYLNTRVYSCSLILNSIPNKWRGMYNEDTDICLQVLADGWCTVLINAFTIDKIASMHMKGGNTDQLYKGRGRLKMARSLERLWPGVVGTHRRFGRPQHFLNWKKFDTPLKLKKEINLEKLPKVNNRGLKLKVIGEVKGTDIKNILNTFKSAAKK